MKTIRSVGTVRRLTSLVLLGLTTVVGCGGGGPIKGKVTYQGKPVVWGSITLIGSDGVPYESMLETDGSFTVKGMPPGTAKVGVVSSNPENQGRPAAVKDERPVQQEAAPDRPKPAKGTWFPLPDKFGDPLTSGVTATVASGQSLTIDLK